MTASIAPEEIAELIEYARTADISHDPLVQDLADTLAESQRRIEVLESDLRLATAAV